MPIYDPYEQRMAVRVVYDGVALAGKTTNLTQLCTLFAAQKSSEIYSPGDSNGRTLFFDWMQIMAGVVCGFPLLCQVVSVPGQVVLTPRRRHLLATADVVVYVCESSEAALGATRTGLALFDEIARQRGGGVPLVLQANKQDRAGAMDGAALARALGREGVPVIEGIASEGVGVVDTFVAAVRTVARAIQTRSEEKVLRVHVRRAETASEVLAALVHEDVSPEWAAEMLLEEAQAAFLLDEAMAALARDGQARAAAALAADELVGITASGSEARAPREPVAASGASRTDRDGTGSAPLPTADVPTGFIWPAHTGRASVRALGFTGISSRRFDPDGVLTEVSNGHVARTSLRSQFASGESARQALVRSARECTQLDRLLPSDTVLIAQPAADGTCWLWSVRPVCETIAQMLRAKTASPEILAAYGAAVVEALRASLRSGFSVDLSPAAFGVQQGVIRYLAEVVPQASDAATLSSSMFSAAESIERAGADVTTFLESFEREIKRRLSVEERARTLPLRELPKTSGAAHASASATERLYAVLSRANEAR